MGFFLLLAVLLSRGVLENAVGKNAAYAVQLGVIVAFTFLLLVAGGPRPRTGRTWILPVAYVFVLVALISAWASLSIQGIDYFWQYLLVTFFYVATLVVYSLIDFDVMRRIAVGPVLALLGLALVGVAFAQQYGGFTSLPGGDLGTFGSLLRPASLTGSFLHYPIAASLIVFLLLGIGEQRRKRIYWLVAAIVALGVVTSLSRSGMVILLVGLFCGVALIPTLSRRFRAVCALFLGGSVLLFFLPAGPLLDRFTSIFDAGGSGNTIRIEVWTSVIDLWAASPILVGSHTGQFTNVTSNTSGFGGQVAESGVLQMLVSFGVIGLVAYYALMVGTLSALRRQPPWFIAGAIGGIAQSAVYQSIEVLPFMVLFALFPMIASANTPVTPGSHRSLKIHPRKNLG